jgi:uncharacterized protein
LFVPEKALHLLLKNENDIFNFQGMIEREELQEKIERAIGRSLITTILGPRQCGKTTISKIIGDKLGAVFYDLEDPVSLRILKDSPYQIMDAQKGLIILDEIQRLPEIFPFLRVLADRPDSASKFLLLGSASPDLMRNASESLAGRVAFIDMEGFNIWEIKKEELSRVWFRGSFPRSFLAYTDDNSYFWRQDFIRTFLERDIPQLGIGIPAETMRRFWTMLAHYHGQIWNGSEFARAIGSSEPTARRYLDILSGAYVVRQIQPWFENISKRQVKSPKIYIRDSGLLHALLFLKGDQITAHPKIGASWEGFVIEQIISLVEGPVYFWATHAGAELDLFTFIEGKRIGFEIKYADAPGLTRSIDIAMEDLSLDKVIIVYPGEKVYQVKDNIVVTPPGKLKEVLMVKAPKYD